MNIKIECGCGTRYSFEVEPNDGRMPFTGQCPACHADGTEAANRIIASSSPAPAQPPGLSIHHAPPATTLPPEPPIAVPLDLRAVKARKRKAEERAWRKGLWVTGGVVALVLAFLGGWGWYAFVGSKPHLAAWLKLEGGGPAHVQFLGKDKILIVTAANASARDLSLKKVLWSAPLGANSSGAGGSPQVFADGGDLWICLGNEVKWLEADNGSIKQTIPIPGHFVSFSPTEEGLLVVSEQDETERTATHIELKTGAVSSQEITVPRKQKQALPDDLPPNVQPTAAVLVSQALEEQKFNKPLDAVSSEFFSAGENLVELRVKLLEPKLTFVQSIKPRGPSQLNGQTTASTSSSLVAEEVFNDLKRSQTGGVRRVDESRYEVRLRRWTGAQPVEWKDEVTGAPSFFPLSTVDLLTAGHALLVFDKQNKLLFESKLTYPVSDRFTANQTSFHAIPAAERAGTLYFFDQGVLTAFSLPDGAVRWRLTSFGVSSIQFDDQGMLYVDTTAAGPEDIQYADTISFEKIPSVLLKVDPASGKILWKAQERGENCLVSDKFLYAASVTQGGLAVANALSEALNTPAGESPVYFHLYRINPATGETLWALYDQQRPAALEAQDNRILLLFGDNLELFRYMAF